MYFGMPDNQIWKDRHSLSFSQSTKMRSDLWHYISNQVDLIHNSLIRSKILKHNLINPIQKAWIKPIWGIWRWTLMVFTPILMAPLLVRESFMTIMVSSSVVSNNNLFFYTWAFCGEVLLACDKDFNFETDLSSPPLHDWEMIYSVYSLAYPPQRDYCYITPNRWTYFLSDSRKKSKSYAHLLA